MKFGEVPGYTPDDVIESLVSRAKGGRVPKSSTIDRLVTIHASSQQPDIFDIDDSDIEHEELLSDIFDEYQSSPIRQREARVPSVGDTLRAKNQRVKFE